MSDEPEAVREQHDEVEVVDGLPVLAEFEATALAQPAALPAIQAAAMTAGGFFAGALAMALVKRIAGRKLAEVAPPPQPVPAWPAGGTRTYLVHVRLISHPHD